MFSFVASYVNAILQMVLLLSATAIGLFALRFLVHRRARTVPSHHRTTKIAGTLDQLVKVAGIFSAMGALIVALVNQVKPVGVLPQPDPGKETLIQFYDALQARDYRAAFAKIHPTRLEQIRERHPSFGLQQFADSYHTTRQYHDRTVRLLHEDPSVQVRTYRVAFDVRDEIPGGAFLAARRRLVKDCGEFLNLDRIPELVLGDLQQHYDVPDAARGAIRQRVLNVQLESLFDPMFIYELQRSLKDDFHLALTEKPGAPTPQNVWRHFIQTITMLPDGANWRISDGLATPNAQAIYSSPPTS